MFAMNLDLKLHNDVVKCCKKQTDVYYWWRQQNFTLNSIHSSVWKWDKKETELVNSELWVFGNGYFSTIERFIIDLFRVGQLLIYICLFESPSLCELNKKSVKQTWFATSSGDSFYKELALEREEIVHININIST